MDWMTGFIPSTMPLVDLRENQLRIPPRSSRTVAATLFICGTLECATQPGHRSSPRAADSPPCMGQAARSASAIARARAASGRSDMSDAFLAAWRPVRSPGLFSQRYLVPLGSRPPLGRRLRLGAPDPVRLPRGEPHDVEAVDGLGGVGRRARAPERARGGHVARDLGDRGGVVAPVRLELGAGPRGRAPVAPVGGGGHAPGAQVRRHGDVGAAPGARGVVDAGAGDARVVGARHGAADNRPVLPDAEVAPGALARVARAAGRPAHRAGHGGPAPAGDPRVRLVGAPVRLEPGVGDLLGVAEAHRPLEEPGRHPRLSVRVGTSRRADPRADIVPLAGLGPIRPEVC